MKRQPVRILTVASVFLASIVIAGVVSCSSNSTKDGGQFSGTWSCPASLAPLGSTLTITENLDGTLTLASPADGGGTFCPSDNWTFSGSTATIDLSANASGLSCLGPNGTEVITVNSFSLTANGNTLTGERERDREPGEGRAGRRSREHALHDHRGDSVGQLHEGVTLRLARVPGPHLALRVS